MPDELTTYRISQVEKRLDEFSAKLDLIHADVLTLKTKAAAGGAVAGFIVTTAISLLGLLTGFFQIKK